MSKNLPIYQTFSEILSLLFKMNNLNNSIKIIGFYLDLTYDGFEKKLSAKCKAIHSRHDEINREFCRKLEYFRHIEANYLETVNSPMTANRKLIKVRKNFFEVKDAFDKYKQTPITVELQYIDTIFDSVLDEYLGGFDRIIETFNNLDLVDSVISDLVGIYDKNRKKLNVKILPGSLVMNEYWSLKSDVEELLDKHNAELLNLETELQALIATLPEDIQPDVKDIEMIKQSATALILIAKGNDKK